MNKIQNNSPNKIKIELESPNKLKEDQIENINSEQSPYSPNRLVSQQQKVDQKHLALKIMSKEFISEQSEDSESSDFFSPDKKNKSYLLNLDYDKLLNLLEKLVKKKKEFNIVQQTISDIANENGIDEQYLTRIIMRFISKRQMLDAGQLQSKNEVCLIQERSMQFLKKSMSPYKKETSPQQKSQITQLQPHQLCNHFKTEEDNQLQYVMEYKRFIEFQQSLKQKLKIKDYPMETLIKRLMEDVENLESKFSAQEKKLFKSRDAIKSLFENPMLYIIMSQNEIENILEKEDLLSAQGVSPHKLMLSSKGKVLVNKRTNFMLEQVGMEFLKDKKQEDNFQIQIISQDQLKESINKRMRQKTLIEKELQSLENSQERKSVETQNKEEVKNQLTAEESLKLFKAELEQKIISVTDKFRQEQINKLQEISIIYSVYPPVNKLLKKETTKQINEIQYEKRNLAALINDLFLDNIIKITKKMKDQIKQNDLSIQDQTLHDYLESDDDNLSQESVKSIERKKRVKKQKSIEQVQINIKKSQIYNEIEANNQFYKQAKHEIIGYNGLPNQQSNFYQNCTQQQMLPQPVFKCIKNNTLQFQGKNMAYGYALALEKYLKGITKQENFVQYIHLDDCMMKDTEFKLILKGIRESKIGLSLQNLIYSNNEMGMESINEINEIMKMGIQIGRARALKQICLTNIKVKQMNDLRQLFQYFAENGQFLNVFKIQQTNINDNKVIQYLCEYMKENKNLLQLELSSCCLQAKHLLLISEQIQTTDNIQVLDLSGNPLSELVEENQIKQALFLNKLIDFLNLYRCKLYSLNLQGMLLGKKLIYFIEKIKKNQTLIQINFINNLLTLEDEMLIQKKLNIRKKQDSYYNITKKFDMVFNKQLNRLKLTHLIEDNKNFNITKKSSDVVNSIINAGIVKELRSNKNLQKKLTPFSQIGEIFGSTGSTKEYGLVSEQLDSQIDRLYLRRSLGFHEMIYNQLGQDHLYKFDQSKANNWNLIEQDPKVPSWQSDIRQHQYILIYIDIDNMGSTFTKVKDQETIQILRKYYALDIFDQNVPQNKYSQLLNPIVFGTFNDWKPMQTMKTYQYSLLVCASDNDEIKLLIDYAFDENFFDSQQSELQQMFQSSQQVISHLCSVQNAMVIGQLPNDPKAQQSSKQKTYIYSGFVLPGKHSVFVYLPETKQFYRKLIAVEAQESFFNRQSLQLWNQMSKQATTEQGERIKLINDKIKQLNVFKTQNPVIQSNDIESAYSLINDLLHNNISLVHIIDPVQYLNFNKHFQDPTVMIQDLLDSIASNYQDICTFFRELQSECQDSYPYVSYEHLKAFSKDLGLCTSEILDKSLIREQQSVRTSINIYKLEDDQKPIQKSIFENLDRSKFIKFLVWIWFQEFFSNKKHKYQFSAFIKKRLVDKLKKSDDQQDWKLSSKLQQIKTELQQNEEIQKVIGNESNQETFQRWLDKQRLMNSLSPREITIIFINKAKIPISVFNLKKFYALSKKLIAFEQYEGNKRYFEMDSQEFIELVYRVADHLYNEQNYDEEALKLLDKEHKDLFQMPMNVKFFSLLKTLFRIDEAGDKYQILENLDVNDDQDGYGEAMAKYLDDNCAKEYLLRI